MGRGVPGLLSCGVGCLFAWGPRLGCSLARIHIPTSRDRAAEQRDERSEKKRGTTPLSTLSYPLPHRTSRTHTHTHTFTKPARLLPPSHVNWHVKFSPSFSVRHLSRGRETVAELETDSGDKIPANKLPSSIGQKRNRARVFLVALSCRSPTIPISRRLGFGTEYPWHLGTRRPRQPCFLRVRDSASSVSVVLTPEQPPPFPAHASVCVCPPLSTPGQAPKFAGSTEPREREPFPALLLLAAQCKPRNNKAHHPSSLAQKSRDRK